MTRQKPIMTQAKVVNGRMYTLQDDGSWQETQSETDWAKVDAQTEADMRRFAEEDGEADDFDRDIDIASYRVHRPVKPNAAE